MSGIVGIFHLDSGPVDRLLLRRMTEFLAFRGPDAQEIWSAGPVGFGHAMLRTTNESVRERQPASLDGQVWITADARIDGRLDLVRELQLEGRDCSEATPDPELILHAYHVWDEECVERLLGDFAFAIWDGRHRRLFCGRDHFGVKPFYYAQVGNCLVFSNTLDCLRLHRSASDKLNVLAVADFLLFGSNQELDSTIFADLRRLRPAHTLTWSQGDFHTHRYWTLPIEDPISYQRADEYVEHFRELLRRAVRDRLRTNCVGVFMSGGLDSTTVAATAKEVAAKWSSPGEIHAHTVVYDRLIPDEERRYSGMVAEALGIPVGYLLADNYALYERWDDPEVYSPEPNANPLQALEVDLLRQAAAHSRVVLTGNGGDPALSMSLSSHLWKLGRGLQLGRLARDFGLFMMCTGRLSRLYLRTRLRAFYEGHLFHPSFPTWVNEEFAARLSLRERWERLNKQPLPGHPYRPLAYQALVSPVWTFQFEASDPGATGIPVESRNPFFDIRMLKYLLRLPPLPWSADKELFRRAMRGILPEPVRLRQKTPLAADPASELVKRGDGAWVDQLEPESAMRQFVDWSRLPGIGGEKDPYRCWINLRPRSLNFWLHSQSAIWYKYSVSVARGGRNGTHKAAASQEGL